MKLAIATLVLILGTAYSAPAQAPQDAIEVIQSTPTETTVVVEEPKPEPKPKEKSWAELTNAEKIKKNPQKCDLNTQIMWASDGSCHAKVVKTIKPSYSSTPANVKAPSGSCRDWMVQAGVPAAQMDAAYTLIMRESGCRVNAYNPSGAFGIPQSLPGSKMASMGSDWQTNPVTQIRWMISYVNGRYGGFPQALAHSYAHNWY